MNKNQIIVIVLSAVACLELLVFNTCWLVWVAAFVCNGTLVSELVSKQGSHVKRMSLGITFVALLCFVLLIHFTRMSPQAVGVGQLGALLFAPAWLSYVFTAPVHYALRATTIPVWLLIGFVYMLQYVLMLLSFKLPRSLRILYTLIMAVITVIWWLLPKHSALSD